jgi:hypothetical protein
MEGKSVHEARRKQQQLDRKWRVGENRAAANQVHFDEEEEHEVSADIFEATVREVLAARMQGEAGCAGLQVLLAAGVEDMLDEQEMQVFQAGAFEAMDGYKQIDSGLSYFHLLSEQKWFPLGGTTKHKVTLEVARTVYSQ